MSKLDKFRAINFSGSLIPDPDAVTAMALLFEKVYLPNDLEIVCDFARRFHISNGRHRITDISIESDPANEDDDPLSELTERELKTAHRYLAATAQFSMTYASLYGEVLESQCFPDGNPLEVELIREGASGELNTYRVSQRESMEFRSGGANEVSDLIMDGYVPVVGNFFPTSLFSDSVDAQTSSQIAALLAIKSVQLIIPRTRAASAATILEARERLCDHLPHFWAAMLKLSRDLRSRIDGGMSADVLQLEASNLVDDTVRPALIELKHKMNLERKQWFYRVLSPVQKGLRLLIGNPPLTQQQLLTNALLLGSDVAMSAAGHLQQIEGLKSQSGLTMLLKAEQAFEDEDI